MNANPILLQMKYARIVNQFAKEETISLDSALDFFYHSTTYDLISNGISDMHCKSDAYLIDNLRQEYHASKLLIH